MGFENLEAFKRFWYKIVAKIKSYGVYVGDIEPSDATIKVWIDTSDDSE